MGTTKLSKDRLPQITKDDVGLSNVDNTSDLNKPISTATQTALDTKVSGTVGGAGSLPYSNGASVIFTSNIYYQSGTARFGVGTISPNSKLHVSGSFAGGYKAITAPVTMDSLDYAIEITGAGGFTQSVISAIGVTGRILEFINSSTGTITLQGTSTQLIGSANTYLLLSNQSIILKSNGTNWMILGGRLQSLTSSGKNEAGQIKVNYTGLSITGFTNNTSKQFDIAGATPTIVASPITKYPNSTPNSYIGFFDSARNGGTTTFAGRLIENPIQGQPHRFRIQGTYTNKANNNTGALDIILRNPVSGFTSTKTITLPTNRVSGAFDEVVLLIADNASIISPNGYILEVQTSFTDTNLIINITSITRFSDAIEP